MGKRRSVPEDLMGTILSENLAASDGSEDLPGSRGSSGGVSWDERPERVGVTFNLSKQLCAELEKLRAELRPDEHVRPSRSEIVEVALRIAVEDARERGEGGELFRRLAGRRASRDPGVAGGTTRRSVDESGLIFETTHDESGDVLDEEIVGTVADLPVMDEYLDDQGRLVSVARDERGNTYEQVVDEAFNVLGARILPTGDREHSR